MRHLAQAVSVLALTLAACSTATSTEQLAACGDACEATQKTFGMANRNVHDAVERTFTSDGEKYTLVRFEYGDTEECDLFGNCSYSVYCGFVVGGKDFPLEVTWMTDADELFDPAIYCEDGELEGCELPGQTLAILEDEAFEEWVYETDPEDDILVDCFAEYW